ncbi:MAG: 50S ribosomal protein L23 [Verrucomicrobia bacterium]|nr:MAG: 50S ribosomal protein L23 [Verrucomicrobiota bacterium]
MINAEKIIKGFRVTEKATDLQVANKYTFEVSDDANAVSVACAVERAFKVTVEKVNIMNAKGKVKVSRMRKANPGVKGRMKKAIVTLKKGDTIQLA